MNDYLLIKADKKAEKTSSSGLLIMDGKEEIQDRGEVLEIGSKVKDIEKGQTVIFRKFAPEPVEVDGVDMLLVQESDVLALIT